MHFSWPLLRTLRGQTSLPTAEAQASQRCGGAEHSDTVERRPSGDVAPTTTSPVPSALQHPERRRAVAGTNETVAGRAAPAAGALEPPTNPLQELTLAALDAWAAAPHQSPEERVERQRVVALLTTPSFFPIRRRRCLKLPKNLDLGGCRSLSSLPGGLSVGGDLSLRNCTPLSSLPEGLSVGGDLSLRNCTPLSSLPEGLSVGGGLFLGGCTSLSSLPEGLSVGGDLFINSCTSLSSLPESILRWSPMRDGRPHRLVITGSGLSAAVVASIQRAAGEGVQVVFGAGREHDAQAGFVDLSAAHAFWQPLVAKGTEGAGHAAPPGPIVAAPHEQRSLLLFLGRLRDTADFRNAHSRPLLAGRVLELLQRMQGAPEVAALCHERIGQALESCGDRVIWAMNQLELALRTHDAQSTVAPEAALRSLAAALVRLEVVHRHAADRCAALRVVDPIEVYLAYETALAGPLQLPLSTQGMLYAGLSNVTEGDIEKARQAAMQAGDDAERVESFLCAWAPWQAYLRRTETVDVERVWRGLVPAPAPAAVADDDCCSISQNTLAELRAGGGRPVVVEGPGGAWQVYDFASLLTWYRQHGTHPVQVAKPLRLEDVYSLPDI